MGTKHYQLPSVDGNYNTKEFEILNLGDRYIYLWMKTRMDYESKQSFPSYKYISDNINEYCEDATCTPIKVKNAIKRLEQVGWIEIEGRFGTSNLYRFKELAKFERFSEEFLQNKKYTWKEKDFYMQLQQYIFKDYDNQTAFITWTNSKIASMLHLSPQVISRYMNALKKKQAFVEIKTTYRDPATKLPIIRREFNLQALNQLFVLLEKHENDIQETKENLRETKDDVAELKEQIKKLTKEVEQLKNQDK